jgi:hypothetical protein
LGSPGIFAEQKRRSVFLDEEIPKLDAVFLENDRPKDGGEEGFAVRIRGGAPASSDDEFPIGNSFTFEGGGLGKENEARIGRISEPLGRASDNSSGLVLQWETGVVLLISDREEATFDGIPKQFERLISELRRFEDLVDQRIGFHEFGEELLDQGDESFVGFEWIEPVFVRLDSGLSAPDDGGDLRIGAELSIYLDRIAALSEDRIRIREQGNEIIVFGRIASICDFLRESFPGISRRSERDRLSIRP